MKLPVAPSTTRRLRTGLVSLLSVLAVLIGLAAFTQPAAAGPDGPTTYADQSYASTVARPSEDKPQSKLWYNDGSWWALMVASGGTLVHIHELLPDHTFRDTGTVVDTRVNGTGDALWSPTDNKLFVATRSDTDNVRVARFSYDSATRSYASDVGFPIVVNSGGGSESTTIDRDSTGKLWLTYTRQSKLWVAHSDSSGANWTAGFQPSVPDTVLLADDISALVAFQGNIGVLYSDHQSDAFHFAIHKDTDPDTTWRMEDALAGLLVADDHINLKQLTDDPQGRIFAAIKNSVNDDPNADPNATLVGVLIRTPRSDGTGDWRLVPAGTVADDFTRPIIMIDSTNQELYFFGTAPQSGGDIFYKKTSLANPSFPPGRGTPFVDYTKVVNNASGAKNPVTTQTGLVVLAVAEGVKRYVHAEMSLGGVPPADTVPPTVPTGLTATPSSGQVALSWTASTDNVGVTGYIVRRNGTQVAAPATPGYTDTAVTAGQTYSYTVEATDAAGNPSGQTAAVTATVPDDPPPSGITLRAGTTATNAVTNTLTVPTPAAQAGDLLLASVQTTGKPAITAPAGWQLVRRTINASAMQLATYRRVAGAAEPASYTWRLATAQAAVGEELSYSGVSTSTPIQAHGGKVTASSTKITAPSIGTTAQNALLIGVFGVAKTASVTPPVGMTERTEVRSSAGQVTGETADQLRPSPGTTGTRVATSSVAGPNIGQLVALNPGG